MKMKSKILYGYDESGENTDEDEEDYSLDEDDNEPI